MSSTTITNCGCCRCSSRHFAYAAHSSKYCSSPCRALFSPCLLHLFLFLLISPRQATAAAEAAIPMAAPLVPQIRQFQQQQQQQQPQLLMQLDDDPFVRARIVEIVDRKQLRHEKEEQEDNPQMSAPSLLLLPPPSSLQLSPKNASSSSSIIPFQSAASFPPLASFASWPRPHSLFHAHPVLASLIALLVMVLILATVLGNLGVCLAILMVRKLKSQPANLLLISLAVADFCVGLFVMPMAAVYVLEDRWVFGELLCRFWVTADLTLCTASILNLCAISVDRHLAVTRALRYSAIRTRRRICLYICVVWLGALLVSAAPLALLPFPETDQHCQVSQNRFYQIYATIISFWGPSLIMVIVYVKLWMAAKRMQRQDRMVLRWQGLSNVSEADSDAHANNSLYRNGIITVGGKDSRATSIAADNTLRNNSIARANAHFLFALHRSAQQRMKQRMDNGSNNNGNSSSRGGPKCADDNNNLNGLSAAGRASAGGASLLGTAIRIPLLSNSSNTHQKPHHEDKARKTLGVIMSVFIICWVPFFILALAKSQRWIQHVPGWLDSLALWLGYSNSMLNPLIYCKYNREFRIPFGEMICCRFCTIQDVMRNESYYLKFGSPRVSESRSGLRSARNGGTTIRTERSYATQDGVGPRYAVGGREDNNSLMVEIRKLSVNKRNSSPGALVGSDLIK